MYEETRVSFGVRVRVLEERGWFEDGCWVAVLGVTGS